MAASGITESVLEEIKARTDLADLIASYGITLRRSGASTMACCPFHHEKTPSFHINTAKGFYHCFGCGESGDAIKFVQKYEGLSFVEAVKKLAAAAGVKIEERSDPDSGRRKRLYALMAELAQFYHEKILKSSEAAAAREYLKKRGLDGAPCEDFLIGYAPNGGAAVMEWAEKHGYTPEEMEAAGVVKPPDRPGGSFYHRFAGRLMFTVRDRQSRVVAFSGRQLVEKKNSGKYVNSPETPIFKKSNVLFAFDKAAQNITRSPHREVICCEGQIDAIRLHICGFTNAVASQGTAFTEEHANMIKRFADAAVLMYDDDAAGHKATVRVAAMLLAMGMPVRVASLPDGDDPDSYLRKHRPAELQTIIDAAESVVSFQCRVERAKERNPGSIDAVARVTRAVLETVAACSSAVLKATLTDEAAKILKLPVAALNDELSKLQTPRPATAHSKTAAAGEREQDAGAEAPSAVASAPEPDPAGFVDGGAASDNEPPSALETAFMAFLLANEHDAAIAAATEELLPSEAFANGFTKSFVSAWLDETRGDGDRLAAFATGLDRHGRGWFDKVVADTGLAEPSTLEPIEILHNFARDIWCAALERRRGEMPAAGDRAAETARMDISMKIKQLRQSGWNVAKNIITKVKKGETAWT
jgi:DNA primase